MSTRTPLGEEGLIQVLAGHTGPVTACAFSPDGALLVSASHDHTLRVWDAASCTERHVLRGHTSSVEACAFSPDGGLVVSASFDETVRVWDAASGTQRQCLRRPQPQPCLGLGASAVALDRQPRHLL